MKDGSYWMRARWGGRVETPQALAERFTKTIDAIRPLHPLLGTWTWGDFPEIWETEGDGGQYPFSEVRTNLAPAIERNASDGEGGLGTPDPRNGYFLVVRANDRGSDLDVSLSLHAGEGLSNSPALPFTNHAKFTIDEALAPSLASYALMRTVMLIVCEIWEATWAETLPNDLRSEWRSGSFVRCAWMTYVSPRFAPLIAPPASAIVEHRPNGGLFLAATDQVFKRANPTHMATARDIEAALQPLARVPWPVNDPYLPRPA